MPARQLATLLGLFCLCLAIVGIAWASGSELYLFLPVRRHRCLLPPTHPSVILGVLVACLIFTVWVRQTGVYFFIMVTVGILLGTVVGHFVFSWTPSWSQHLLAAAMIVTSVYAWNQKAYFEE